jgi:hypothetical protein
MCLVQSRVLLLMLSINLPNAARKIAPRPSARLLAFFVLGATPLARYRYGRQEFNKNTHYHTPGEAPG